MSCGVTPDSRRLVTPDPQRKCRCHESLEVLNKWIRDERFVIGRDECVFVHLIRDNLHGYLDFQRVKRSSGRLVTNVCFFSTEYKKTRSEGWECHNMINSKVEEVQTVKTVYY
jgi:hypothetical protein